MPRQKGISRSMVRRSVTRRIASSGVLQPPRGARVPKPSIAPPKGAVVKDPSIFTGLPKGSIGKHLGQFNRTLDFLKSATGGRFGGGNTTR